MEYLISSSTGDIISVNINQISALYHNIEGTKCADEGRIKEALNNFTKAIELNPVYAVAFFNRGTIKADMGDFNGAKADFQKARELELSFESSSNEEFRRTYSKV